MTWNPEDYAKHSGAQQSWAQDLIARLKLAGAEAVLDVGCGDGKITAELARAVPEGFVLGIDNSEDFIEYARSHYPPEQFPNLRFEVMDARRLACERHFDVIFSNAVLHWVDDHPAFLVGCARLLNPGGRLVVSCGGTGNASEITTVLDRLMQAPRWKPYFDDFAFPYYFYAPSDYEPWLTQAGFKVDRLELVEKDMIQPDPRALAGWIRTTWLRFIERVPEDRRESFIAAVVEGYLAQHPLDGEGCCHVKMVRLEFEVHR